jgi:hypothetical protein
VALAIWEVRQCLLFYSCLLWVGKDGVSISNSGSAVSPTMIMELKTNAGT